MKMMPWLAAAALAGLACPPHPAAAQTAEPAGNSFERVPYLGVASSPIGEALSRQLDLPLGGALSYVQWVPSLR